MLSKKKWVAVINGNKWVVAEISSKKEKLTIHRLAELDGKDFNPEKENANSELEGTLTVMGEEGDIAVNTVSKAHKQASTLREWLKKSKVPLKKLEIALSCPGVITRMITLPKLSEKDLEKLLTEQVDQYFTLNISDYVVDYRILEKVTEEDQERLRVLLVAIPLVEWEKQWKLWENIGFVPQVTDFSADCLCRFYHQVCVWGEEKGKEPVSDLAIVELGSDRVEFVLMEHGLFFLYSDMGISLDNLEFSPVTSQEEYQNELEDRLYPVFNTLSEFLNFFGSRHYGKSVDQIFITGDCADLPYLEDLFERNMGVPSKVGFPKGWKPNFSKKSQKSLDHWMKYGSLYGLAIREG